MARQTRRRQRVLRLRKLRRDREWTLQYVGDRIGASDTAVCLYEGGTRTPSLKKARKLAELYGVSVEALFDEIEVPA